MSYRLRHYKGYDIECKNVSRNVWTATIWRLDRTILHNLQIEASCKNEAIESAEIFIDNSVHHELYYDSDQFKIWVGYWRDAEGNQIGDCVYEHLKANIRYALGSYPPKEKCIMSAKTPNHYEIWGGYSEDAAMGAGSEFFETVLEPLSKAREIRDQYLKNPAKYAYIRDMSADGETVY